MSRLGYVPELQRLKRLLDAGGLPSELQALVTGSLEGLSEELSRSERVLEAYDRSSERLGTELE